MLFLLFTLSDANNMYQIFKLFVTYRMLRTVYMMEYIRLLFLQFKSQFFFRSTFQIDEKMLFFYYVFSGIVHLRLLCDVDISNIFFMHVCFDFVKCFVIPRAHAFQKKKCELEAPSLLLSLLFLFLWSAGFIAFGKFTDGFSMCFVQVIDTRTTKLYIFTFVAFFLLVHIALLVVNISHTSLVATYQICDQCTSQRNKH